MVKKYNDYEGMELASEDSFDADDFTENPTVMAKDNSQAKRKQKRSSASRQVFQVAKDRDSGVVFLSRWS